MKFIWLSDGYKVFKAENAAQGLEILEKEEIHLVLLDIMMPGDERTGYVQENPGDQQHSHHYALSAKSNGTWIKSWDLEQGRTTMW